MVSFGSEHCFHLSGFLGSLFSFLQFLCCPLIGAASDVFGRRGPMILCMVRTGYYSMSNCIGYKVIDSRSGM